MMIWVVIVLARLPGYDFMDVPNNAYAGVTHLHVFASSPYSMWGNPTYIEGEGVVTGYMNMGLDIQAGNVGYYRAPWGVSISYWNFGEMLKGEPEGIVPGETFTPCALRVTAAYRRQVRVGLKVGVAGGVVYQTIEKYRSIAVMCDVGGTYRWQQYPIEVGVLIRNLGTEVSSSSATREALPVSMELGARYEWDKLTLSAAYVIPYYYPAYLSIACDYHILNGIALRVGYTTLYRGVIAEELAALLLPMGFGFDISYRKLCISYGVDPRGPLGIVHYLNFVWKLGG